MKNVNIRISNSDSLFGDFIPITNLSYKFRPFNNTDPTTLVNRINELNEDRNKLLEEISSVDSLLRTLDNENTDTHELDMLCAELTDLAQRVNHISIHIETFANEYVLRC